MNYSEFVARKLTRVPPTGLTGKFEIADGLFQAA